MKSKKIFLSSSAIVVIAMSLFLGVLNNSKSHANVSDVTLANIDAFVRTQSLDCRYYQKSEECTITVGAKGKIKLLGGSILEAGADGKITIDGKVICEAGGNQSCEPITCKNLYEVIFSSETNIQ